MLDVRDISVTHSGRKVLRAVSLSVADGEVVAVRGPSGSGKSTLLRVIAGLLVPASGSVWMDGADITSRPTHLRHIGMVFQDNQLFGHLTVHQNVAFGMRMQHVGKAEAARRVGRLLELVGLPDFGPRSVQTLSGGEAKRVALARSLAPQPRVLLLDEPLTGLDEALHDRLLHDLRDLLAAQRITTVLVTHSAAEAASLAMRAVSIDDLGRGS
jgi:thiamine transport system ATP-binding protein